jgi:hypothetical protein
MVDQYLHFLIRFQGVVLIKHRDNFSFYLIYLRLCLGLHILSCIFLQVLVIIGINLPFLIQYALLDSSTPPLYGFPFAPWWWNAVLSITNEVRDRVTLL